MEVGFNVVTVGDRLAYRYFWILRSSARMLIKSSFADPVRWLLSDFRLTESARSNFFTKVRCISVAKRPNHKSFLKSDA